MNLLNSRAAAISAAFLLTCSLQVCGLADEAKTKSKPISTTENDVPTFNLLDAMDKGLVGVEAEGIGDGRMTVAVTNRTKGQLRVVLPPGLVAQGASGQMGGMGGMGGGGMGGGGKGGGGVGGGGGGGRGGGGKD